MHTIDIVAFAFISQILMNVWIIMAHAPMTVSTLKVVIIVSVLLDISFNPTNMTVKVSIVDFTVPFHEHLWVYGYVYI